MICHQQQQQQQQQQDAVGWKQDVFECIRSQEVITRLTTIELPNGAGCLKQAAIRDRKVIAVQSIAPYDSDEENAAAAWWIINDQLCLSLCATQVRSKKDIIVNSFSRVESVMKWKSISTCLMISLNAACQLLDHYTSTIVGIRSRSEIEIGICRLKMLTKATARCDNNGNRDRLECGFAFTTVFQRL